MIEEIHGQIVNLCAQRHAWLVSYAHYKARDSGQRMRVFATRHPSGRFVYWVKAAEK